MTKTLSTLLIINLVFSILRASEPANHSYLYVSLRGDNAIAVYKRNIETGTPKKIYNQAVPGGPASMAFYPEKQMLYVAQRSSNSISAYKINATDGKLTLAGTIAAVDNPVYISLDINRKFLLTTYFNANKAAIYALNNDGTLQPTPIQTVATGTNPHCIVAHPTNRFVYITNMTGNKIQQYSFDNPAGTMQPLNPFEMVPDGNAGPRHMVFHSQKNMAYTSDEIGNSVTAYRIGTLNGQLNALQSLSTLPATFTSANKPADVHITPNNRFLYVSNRGHESIAAFAIDKQSDSLSPIGYYKTAATPREFDIEPTGKYLYVAGETGNNLVWYKINENDGSLDSLGTVAVGKTPSWVLAVDLSTNTSSRSIQRKKTVQKVSSVQIRKDATGDTAIFCFELTEPATVSLQVFDVAGKPVFTYYKEKNRAGEQLLEWFIPSKQESKGIYLCRLIIGNESFMQKVRL